MSSGQGRAPYDPERHRRRSIRLPAYDYGQPGTYFVTISTYYYRPLFGDICDGTVTLNAFGRIIEDEWSRTPLVRTGIALDDFVVMPNHLHGIIAIESNETPFERDAINRGFQSPSGTVGAVVRGFKAASTRRINLLRPEHERGPVCHRNYYEHVVRNERDLERIRAYIAANPTNWEHDREQP